MKITAAFMKIPGSTDSAWLLSAYNDATEEAHGRVPDFHTGAVADAKGLDAIVREAVITVPDASIEALFASPTIAVMAFDPVTGPEEV